MSKQFVSLPGWGHFQLTPEQQQDFQQFMAHASYVKYISYPEYQPQRDRFAQLLPRIFPGFPFPAASSAVTSMHNEPGLFEPNHYHAGQGHDVTVHGRRNDLFSRAGNNGEIELTIHHSSHGALEYSATLAVHPHYLPSVVDALAERLGKREQPALSGLKPVYEFGERVKEIRLGFPDATRLPRLFRVYEEAVRLLEKVSPRLSGLTEQDLNILYRDAYGRGKNSAHENVAVRRSSEHLYSETLDQLCSL